MKKTNWYWFVKGARLDIRRNNEKPALFYSLLAMQGKV